MEIVQTTDLSRRFGSFTAVDSLTLAIGVGEVFGLLGRNGAGKSTLIKMLTTLLPPSGGSARVGGYDIVRDAARVRGVIGYVPQALSADGELTGRENLRVFARLYDLPRALRSRRVDDGLAFMGLSGAADTLVRAYSGGMIRRLEIAQSTLHRPPVLFLDEPTVGLDPVAREAVWNHIRELRARYGTTIVLTSHHMDEVEELCDRVTILRNGRSVALGTPAELRGGTGNPEASLAEAFAYFTGDAVESGAAYRATSLARQSAQRHG